jgi:hypothetical protein
VDRDRTSAGAEEPERLPDSWLEPFTASVLVLILLLVGWMVLRAAWPEGFSLGSEAFEVILVVGLLVLALGLVSWVALRHTRQRRIPLDAEREQRD